MIKDKDGHESSYDNFGTTVPSEVRAVLGNPPIDSEIGPIAYADQHQPLFLVTLSASELPKTISRLTGIDDFEGAAEMLNAKANIANRQIKDSTKRIENLNIQLKDYDNLDIQLAHLEQMEKISSQIDDIALDVTRANELKHKYNELMNMGRVANNALKNAEKVSVLSSKLAPIKKYIQQIVLAKQLLRDYTTLLSLESDAANALKISEALVDKKVTGLLAATREITVKINMANNLKTKYEELINNGKRISNEHNVWLDTLKNKQSERLQLISEMRSAGIWCSVCQRPKSMDVCDDK